jgi:hypothetical protein
MKLRSLPALAFLCLAAGCGDDDDGDMPNAPTNDTSMSFFVSSATNATGNLGGLAGADARCQSLAAAVGQGQKTWRAYLSVERDPATGQATDARSRIGNGPWYNASGVRLAANLTELHALKGDAALFLDERGQRIAGQWPGSPRPVEHDILTGSSADGRLMAGLTCNDWNSGSADVSAQVGHSDGLGPGGDPSGNFGSWNSSHTNQNCSNTAPRGGAGRIYCFARN